MRVLSIKQPWLWGITDLPEDDHKPVENRTWKPPQWIIGKTIALHASKRDDPFGINAIEVITLGITPPDDLPRGAIVATSIIYGWFMASGDRFIIPSKVREFERLNIINSDWFFGPVGWWLGDIQKLSEPIPCNGSRGLWVPPAEVEFKIKRL